jgi:chromosome segregation ATPase
MSANYSAIMNKFFNEGVVSPKRKLVTTEEMIKDVGEDCKYYQSEIDKCDQTVQLDRNLPLQFEKNKSEIEKLKRKYKVVEIDIKSLINEIQKYEEENQKMLNDIEDLKKNISDKELLIYQSQQKRRVKRLKMENTILKQTVGISRKIQIAENELNKINSEQTKIQNLSDMTEKENESLRKMISDLENQLINPSSLPTLSKIDEEIPISMSEKGSADFAKYSAECNHHNYSNRLSVEIGKDGNLKSAK